MNIIMRVILTACLMASFFLPAAQPVLKTGDLFPAMLIRNIINAPVREFDVQRRNKKLLILNFWGTWCSPCLPEMDSLSRLQAKYKNLVQVIGISDEPVLRLKRYLQRRPSSVWLASDTSSNLYLQFGFNYVGQSAVIDRSNRIVALVRTDSINQSLIDRLLHGQEISSSAETGGNKTLAGTDPFAVDSTVAFQVTWSAYRPGLTSMRKTYLKTSFEGRRLTYYNVCMTNMYQDAYRVTNKQVMYEVPEKTLCNWDDKSTLYCLDLVVKPEQKDSLLIILRQMLTKLAPVKVRVEKQVISVYVLRRLPGAPEWLRSAAPESFSFSGQGFEGKGITLNPFIDYVSNELELPVIDETGLSGRYDVVTENVLRTKEDIANALKKLGLVAERTSREMQVIVISR